jgi:hypothetical protein
MSAADCKMPIELRDKIFPTFTLDRGARVPLLCRFLDFLPQDECKSQV